MDIRLHTTIEERRKALEKEVNVSLINIGTFSLDEKTASTKNCENMIGVAQVPMGIAGPLVIASSVGRPHDNHKEYYVPLATTEGALVASVHRGCKAIRLSGGATVDSYRAGVTRGPVFRVKNLEENDRLNVFLEKEFPSLQRIAQSTSHHLHLTKYFSRGLGRQRYVRFVFDTQDAMGMNMATIATDAIVSFIEEKTGIQCLALAGNYDVDKKPSWLNSIEGRGWKAWAEVVLSPQVLGDVLKTNAQSLYDVWIAKCMIGSAMSGSMGFNAQFANIIAAVFLSTGQDLAHVTEGSIGITTMEILSNASDAKKTSLYVGVYLPDLMIGTVGGGTSLGTQKEALSLLGIEGGNNGQHVEILAEVTAGAVLAGEISLLASLSEGTLAKAHKRLGRGA